MCLPISLPTLDIAFECSPLNRLAPINLYFFQIVKERTANDLFVKIKPKYTGSLRDPVCLGLIFGWIVLRLLLRLLLRFLQSLPLMLLRLLLPFNWWRLTGSNRRPPACKAGALPAELNPPGILHIFADATIYFSIHAQPNWWVWLGSNQRPPRYQHGALTN